MSSFYVGQKVVCVHDDFVATLIDGTKIPSRKIETDCPDKGDVLTIRSICGMGGLRFIEHVTLHLKTITGTEPSFAPWRFRPLITLEEDMKHFTGLLNPGPLERLDILAEMLDEI